MKMYSRKSSTGFTLIEVIVVIVLIGGILAVVGGKIITNKKRAEANLARTSLQSLAAQVDQYQADVGSYPESLEQLVKAPGNADGGLTTQEEKSLGAIQKGGQAPVTRVLRYGEQAGPGGLSLIEGPGNDGVSSTAMIATHAGN